MRPRVAKQAPIDCPLARFRWTSAAIRRELGAVRTRTSGPARSRVPPTGCRSTFFDVQARLQAPNPFGLKGRQRKSWHRASGGSRDADEMVWMACVCVARDSRYVYSGACGVDRHSVCPSQGQRRGRGVDWSLPSLRLSQPRAEERARVAWRGVMGLAWILVRVPTDEKTYAEASDVSAAAA